MKKRPGRWLTPLIFAVLVVGLAFLSGCAKDLMEADTSHPTGSAITSPTEGQAVSNPVMNVRGRAEVGATVEIFINDEKKGSGVAAPAENAVAHSNDSHSSHRVLACPLHVLTTVDLDHLAGDVTSPVRAKKGHHVGAFLR